MKLAIIAALLPLIAAGPITLNPLLKRQGATGCGAACVQTVLGAQNLCDLSDTNCICTSSAIINTLSACLKEVCSSQTDYNNAVTYITGVCENAAADTTHSASKPTGTSGPAKPPTNSGVSVDDAVGSDSAVPAGPKSTTVAAPPKTTPTSNAGGSAPPGASAAAPNAVPSANSGTSGTSTTGNNGVSSGNAGTAPKTGGSGKTVASGAAGIIVAAALATFML